MHVRHIPLTEAYNMRDLGGYPTSDQQMTRWNRFYRSDCPADLTKEDWQTLKDLKISLLIDLRSNTERANNPVNPPSGIKLSAHSLMRDLDEVSEEHPEGIIAKSMDLNYTSTLFGNLSCAVAVLNELLAILETKDQAALFFCAAGKDRTGIITAIIFYLCGVFREDIIADYMVSNTYNERGINLIMQSIPADHRNLIPNQQVMHQMLGSDPETIAELLDAFAERDLRKSLDGAGFDVEKQKKLGALFCTPLG